MMIRKCYSDWIGDNDDYVSTNEYIIYFGSTPVFWSSKKQNGVVRSSTYTEYRDIGNTSLEIRWICSHELSVKVPIALVIYCDIVGATYLCANQVFHFWMKHITIDYHFIGNMIHLGMICVSHISTKDQLANTLTKPLSRQQFIQATSRIGVTRAFPS